MFCPHCGASIPDNAQFCPECGMRIERATANEVSDSGAADTTTGIEEKSVESTVQDTPRVPEVDGASGNDVSALDADTSSADEVLADYQVAQTQEAQSVSADDAETLPHEPAPMVVEGTSPRHTRTPSSTQVPSPADQPMTDDELDGRQENQAVAQPITEDPLDSTVIRPVMAGSVGQEPIDTINPSLATGATPLLDVPIKDHAAIDSRYAKRRRQHPIRRISPAPGQSSTLSEHARMGEGAVLEDQAGYYDSVDHYEAIRRRHARRNRLLIVVGGLVMVLVGVLAHMQLIGDPRPSDTASTDAAQQETQTDTQDTGTSTEDAATTPAATPDVTYDAATGQLALANYGFSATLPTGMESKVNDSETGLTMTDASLGMQIDAWVTPNNTGATLNSLFQQAQSAQGITRLTYTWISDAGGWFVVSYWRGDTGYYIREYVNQNRLLAIEFKWPQSQAQAGANEIQTITNSMNMTQR